MTHRHTTIANCIVPPLRTEGRTQVESCRCGAVRVTALDEHQGPEGPTQTDWITPMSDGMPVTIAEAARRVGLSVSAIRQAIGTGRLKASKPMGASYWLIEVAELARFAASLGGRGGRSAPRPN